MGPQGRCCGWGLQCATLYLIITEIRPKVPELGYSLKLENDMQNYLRWKLMGGHKMMKRDAIPHKFEWQETRKLTSSESVPCNGAEKRKKTQDIEDALTAPSSSNGLVIENSSFSPDEAVEQTSSDSSGSTSSLYVPNETVAQSKCSDATNLEKKIQKEECSELAYIHTSRLIELYPEMYVGVSKECMYVIDLLEKYTLSDRRSIYVTLQKVKLAQLFDELGDAFGISESTASKMFQTNIVVISSLLKELIIWPPENKMKDHLPLPFRDRYANVQCIIDCLEIEVQGPSDDIRQASTWSEYRKANTIKYLISFTPDGIINFISSGFGGRTSDAALVEESGFLDKLQPGAVVMAHRGFEHVGHLFILKQCTLLIPFTMGVGQKLSESEVLEPKRFDSLRIHLERVIRRPREYSLLKLYSCVDLELMPFMDYAVTTACGLINLQGPIVKYIFANS